MQIVPSILSADLARLGEQVRAAEAAGADAIQIDVMDGHFVPSITFGPLVVEALRRVTALPLEAHLMVARPESQIGPFIDAGADTIIVHVEATTHVDRLVQSIHARGSRAGVTLNPETPLNTVDSVLKDVEQVQLMGVNPGRGGQTFIPATLERVRTLRERIDGLGLSVALEVDGGVNEKTIAAVAAAGATMVIAGSALYNDRESVTEAMARLRHALEAGGA